jgi:hypothetical protein
MEPVGPLPFTQDPAIGPYLEPDDANQHPFTSKSHRFF